jgi:hypothetical protein
VFIGNIKAAGVGLTLTAASHVVFVEAPWSPSDLQQAADRCHRIGQNVNVTVDLLTIKASIDELILHKILTKMDIIDAIIKESKDMNTKLIAAKLRELAELFEANEEPIAKIIDQANEEPIAKIIDQANEEPIAKIIDQANDNQLKAVEEAAKLVEATKPAKAVKPVPTEPSKQMPIEPITIDTIRQAMAKLIGSGKRDLALSILAKVGVAKVSEIPEDKFDFVMVAINE